MGKIVAESKDDENDQEQEHRAAENKNKNNNNKANSTRASMEVAEEALLDGCNFNQTPGPHGTGLMEELQPPKLGGQTSAHQDAKLLEKLPKLTEGMEEFYKIHKHTFLKYYNKYQQQKRTNETNIIQIYPKYTLHKFARIQINNNHKHKVKYQQLIKNILTNKRTRPPIRKFQDAEPADFNPEWSIAKRIQACLRWFFAVTQNNIAFEWMLFWFKGSVVITNIISIIIII